MFINGNLKNEMHKDHLSLKQRPRDRSQRKQRLCCLIHCCLRDTASLLVRKLLIPKKNMRLNLPDEWLDLSLPIQACSSGEGGCTGIWAGRPSVLDCKAVHRYFPRSRPEERARRVTTQGASSARLAPTDSFNWAVDEDAQHRRGWTMQSSKIASVIVTRAHLTSCKHNCGKKMALWECWKLGLNCWTD